MSKATWTFRESATGESGDIELCLEQGADALASLTLAFDIGLREPRAWYHVGCVVHAARPLQLFQRRRTLQLGNDLTGASELASIRWHRAGLDETAQLEILSLLLAEAVRRARTARPDSPLIVELPGVRDAQGLPPFWQGLGQCFYGGDPAQQGPRWRSWVAALLPRQPVYACFLPESAQAVIGVAGEGAQLLAEALELQGFAPDGHVDIVDGGPVYALPAQRLQRRA